MQKIISQLNDLISSYSLSKLITNGIKIAIVGKPNAGKSSILNSILGYQRAIVTDIAGTTTDTIEETVEYNGISITIIDTAGIRYHTTNTIEKIGQERSKSSMIRRRNCCLPLLSMPVQGRSQRSKFQVTRPISSTPGSAFLLWTPPPARPGWARMRRFRTSARTNSWNLRRRFASSRSSIPKIRK